MNKFYDLTSANDKSIGFDYQYYYFFYLLLGLEEGESIGLEVKDDIHIELTNDNQVFLQLKHTTQNSASGETKNITELDSDLWKTIYNWINVINDPNDGRTDFQEQVKFLEKTSFILVSNKSSNASNKLLSNIIDFNKVKLSLEKLIDYIRDLYNKTQNPTIKGYIDSLLNQSNEWLVKFFNKLRFELDQDNLVNKIKSRIKGKIVNESQIDDVFRLVDSQLRQDYYLNTKSHLKTIISFEDFYRDYRNFFNTGRSDKLPIRKKRIDFDKPLNEQIFIKQLLDIYAVSEKEQDKMLTLTQFMLNVHNHFDLWKKEGFVTKQQIEDFNDDCIRRWENIHDEVYRRIRLDMQLDQKQPEFRDLLECAGKCLDEIRKKELVFEDNNLDVEMSNGQFYLLSNAPRIGWLLDWEEKYAK